VTGAREPRRRLATKSAEALARRIEAEIVADGWQVGQLIGTEPELLALYGVSRPVLREAVRLLEHHMVAESRRGAGGGLRVTAPDPSAVTETAALYLDYVGVRASEMYSARAVLEVRCLELAIERLTEDGIRQLRELVEKLAATDILHLSAFDHRVETVVAELSGDRVLTLFVKVLLQIAYQHGAPPEERLATQGRTEEWRRQQVGIAEAVLAGDAATARVRLLRYLEWAEAFARKSFMANEVRALGTAEPAGAVEPAPVAD
jgi:DNA-binding FadR family transcriptional regulator